MENRAWAHHGSKNGRVSPDPSKDEKVGFCRTNQERLVAFRLFAIETKSSRWAGKPGEWQVSSLHALGREFGSRSIERRLDLGLSISPISLLRQSVVLEVRQILDDC